MGRQTKAAALAELVGDGVTLREAIQFAGMTETGVRKWEARTGNRFLRDRDVSYREIAEGMKPMDAVEYLLGVVESIQSSGEVMDDPVFDGMPARPMVRRFVNHLHKNIGRTMTKEALYQALYFDRADADDLPALKIVDMFACLARKALPARFSIETVWGVGYRMVEVDANEG